MAPLCTAKIEEDCSAQAMLWTPVMNIHQPTLHLFDQLSVCASMFMCVWVLEFYSTTGCPLWKQSSQGFICLSLYRSVFPYHRNHIISLPTHTPTAIKPYHPHVLYPLISQTHYSTKQGIAIINPL